jgi:hypothetical protein
VASRSPGPCSIIRSSGRAGAMGACPATRRLARQEAASAIGQEKAVRSSFSTMVEILKKPDEVELCRTEPLNETRDNAQR